MSTCAIVFARFPEPGRVKTRLTPWLSPEAAAALYRAFLADTLDTLRASTASRRVVAFTPAARAEEMAALCEGPSVVGSDLALAPQAEGDLGARMAAAIAAARDEGATRTVVIGSDCPTLPPDAVDRALAALEQREVVIGPATDGGYYLIGCAGAPPPALFEGIEWGTSTVLAATLERLGGASVALLEPWRDVDERADVEWLVTHLRALTLAGDRRAPRTREALATLVLQIS